MHKQILIKAKEQLNSSEKINGSKITGIFGLMNVWTHQKNISKFHNGGGRTRQSQIVGNL